MVDAEILAYYEHGLERDRLASGRQRIEFLRIWDLLRSCLPTAPAKVVGVGLSAVPRLPGPKTTVKQKPGREMPEFCKAREAGVLRFASGTSVWPANNIPERGVRPLKTQQKISGRLTSDDVTQDRLDIRGYIDTAREHGPGALDVLEQLTPSHPGECLPGEPDSLRLTIMVRK